MASIIQLQYALELVRQKSFSKAAKKCFVTQPTLSMQIQKLEDEYDITIFDRSRKPVAPTQEGAALIAQFQKVLDEFAKIEQIANTAKGHLAGDYRLAIIPTIAPTLLPLLLKGFRRTYPKVTISVLELTTDQIIEQLIGGTIDAGILSTPLSHPMIREQRLFSEPLHIFHSKTTQFKTVDDKVKVEDLPLDRLLVLTEGHCLRTQILDLCSLKEQARHELGFTIEASSLLTLMNMVQSGDYFSIIPHMAIRSLSRSQRESQIKDFAGITPMREIGLVTHRSQIKARIDDAIVKAIGTVIPDRPQEPGKTILLPPI